MRSDTTDASLRLSDLRRAQAADVSLENLLNAITGKIQDCARLAVFEYEAGNEGHDALAVAFRALGEIERESFRTLLDHLRRHLNELQDEPAPATGRFTGRSVVSER
jgi:hypothetical protein